MLLSRRHPVVQLLFYLIGTMTMNLVFGLLILFVFRRNPLGTNASTGAIAQLAVGLLALAVALVMAVRWRIARRKQVAGGSSPEDQDGLSGTDKVFSGARAILRRGGSPWFAGLLGMGVGLPSVDFMAVLVIIATSHKPPAHQTAALVTFILLGSVLLMAPLVGYLFAPAKTLQRIEVFAAWVRSRSQIEYSALLGVAGAILIGVGLTRL